MTFFVISVLTLNIILWIVLLIRFKKLFSTDSIIEKTQEKLEHLIRDIDNAADRDTYLAKETTKRIQSMIEEADLKMELFREATQRLRDMIAEADRINRGRGVAERIAVKTTVDPDSAYEFLMRMGLEKEAEAAKAAEEAAQAKEAEKLAREEAKAKEREEAAKRRAAKTVGSSVDGTVGREVGKTVGGTFGKFGKTLGGNLGATLGRGLLSTFFK